MPSAAPCQRTATTATSGAMTRVDAGYVSADARLAGENSTPKSSHQITTLR